MDIKQRRKDRMEEVAVVTHLGDFCGSSSIHGLQYVGDKERSFPERAFWFLAMLVSLSLIIYMIVLAWMKWEASPVIASLEGRLRNVWEIPFPAITVCPRTKLKPSLFNFTYLRHKNLTFEQRQLMAMRRLVCTENLEYKEEEFLAGETIDNFENVVAVKGDIKRTLLTVHSEMKVTFSLCLAFGCAACTQISIWLAPQMNETVHPFFTHIFRPLITEEGLCFSFNMLESNELFPNSTFHGSGRYLNFTPYPIRWFPDEGYSPLAKDHTYPNRVLGAGEEGGFPMQFFIRDDEVDYSCNTHNLGFKVALHSPAELPRAAHMFSVPLDQKVVAVVRPQLLTTSPSLRAVSPQARQCFFADERKLQFYKLYSLQNCETECLANYTLQECGCVSFHMPRETGTPVCGPGKHHCVYTAPGRLMQQQMRVAFGTETSKKDPCNCLQSCTDLQYNSELSHSPLNKMTVYFESLPENETRVAGLTVIFKQSHFIGNRRSELYGSMDFLANCGGLLGLGLGCSVLSLLEVIYWLCLRVWCRKTTGVKAGSKQSEYLCNE